jgi:hypothetical protein
MQPRDYAAGLKNEILWEGINSSRLLAQYSQTLWGGGGVRALAAGGGRRQVNKTSFLLTKFSYKAGCPTSGKHRGGEERSRRL